MPLVLHGPRRLGAPRIVDTPASSLDVLPTRYQLPVDAAEGDWVEIDQIGAYSNANATHFNGFHPETYVAVADEPPAVVRRL